MCHVVRQACLTVVTVSLACCNRTPTIQLLHTYCSSCALLIMFACFEERTTPRARRFRLLSGTQCHLFCTAWMQGQVCMAMGKHQTAWAQIKATNGRHPLTASCFLQEPTLPASVQDSNRKAGGQQAFQFWEVDGNVVSCCSLCVPSLVCA